MSSTIPQMRVSPLVIAPVVAACAAVGGCGDGPAASDVATVTSGPAEYVAAVERLLRPPAEIASAIAARVDHPDAPPPDQERLDAVVRRAGERLDELRALPVEDGALRAQRDRLGAGYESLVATMGPVVDSLVADRGRDDLVEASEDFFESLSALPAATERAR